MTTPACAGVVISPTVDRQNSVGGFPGHPLGRLARSGPAGRLRGGLAACLAWCALGRRLQAPRGQHRGEARLDFAAELQHLRLYLVADTIDAAADVGFRATERVARVGDGV